MDDADIDAPEAWAMYTDSEEILVAIIDTGCYIFHPDLEPNIWVNPNEIPENGIDDDGNGYIDDIWGWDFFNNDNTVFDPEDLDSDGAFYDAHGTHVAGTVGARGNNGIGITGVNSNVKMMILKFMGPGGGWDSDAILALNYAAEKGAKIINCSFGGGGYSQALKDAIEATGAIVCCSAGNSGDNTDIVEHYPSRYDSENIISVAAMSQNEMPCNYPSWWSTCYGATTVDLYAPGGFILSTVPPDKPPEKPVETYTFAWGTSTAAPHVTGAAALLHSLYPDILLYRTPDIADDDLTIKDIILNTVDAFPQYEGTVLTGGRLNLANALLSIRTPRIISLEATPIGGPPPLEVRFTAVAEDIDGEIASVEWDFGDGSDPVTGTFEPVHVYENNGEYTAQVTLIDNDGLEASESIVIVVSDLPKAVADPSSFNRTIRAHRVVEERLTVSNIGFTPLEFEVTSNTSGIEDSSGEPGSWIQIEPSQGTIEPGESMDLDVTFNLEEVESGPLEGAIVPKKQRSEGA